MDELIRNLIEHKTEENSQICEYLIQMIRRCHINSPEELKKREDDKYTHAFSSGFEKMTDREIVDELFKVQEQADYNPDVEDPITSPEILRNETIINKLMSLEQEYRQTEDIERKMLIVIKMYSLLDWDCFLPYHAYRYIMEGKL